MLNKIFFSIFFITLSCSIWAEQIEIKEESVQKYQLKNGDELKVLKYFHEEPVSKPRKLVVTKLCKNNGKELVLFNANGCDYKDIKLLKNEKLQFWLYKYEPTTGQCLKKSDKPITLITSIPCI